MTSTITKTLISTFTLLSLLSSSAQAAPQNQGTWSAEFELQASSPRSILTNQGKVLTLGETKVDIWDPRLGTGVSSHNIVTLDRSLATLANGKIGLLPETTNKLLVVGSGTSNDAIVFNTQTNSLNAVPEVILNQFSPYFSTLPNGEIFINDFNGSQIYTPDFIVGRTLSNIGITLNDEHWVAPSGKVFVRSSGSEKLYYIDTRATGEFTSYTGPGSLSISDSAMYRPGKIYSPGGLTEPYLTDITGPIPTASLITNSRGYNVKSTGSFNSTTVIMLPNGKVINTAQVLRGGQDNSEELEIWDPATRAWSFMLPPRETEVLKTWIRNIMLLKDGRVFAKVANQTVAGTSAQKIVGRIFTPPYLYNSSGQLANRPTIASAPSKGFYGGNVPVRHGAGDVISRVTLINTNKQRFHELDFTDTGDGVSVRLPASSNIAPPGQYVMYLLNNKGVPSEGHIINISRTVAAPPVAKADYVNVSGSGVISIYPLSNDSGSGLTLNTPSAWSQKGGNVARVGNKLTYKPKAGFNGADKIWYSLKDSQGRSTYGQINITVSGNTGSGRITINALANDTGTGLKLNPPNAWSWKGGNVALVDNKITYKPKAGFNGEDKIWYSLKDSQGRSTYGQVNITVSGNGGTNSPYPVAAQDYITTTTATRITIDVLANDTGNGLVLNAPNGWSLAGGRVALVSNKLIYTSKAGFTGSDKIWYTFKDSQGRSNSGQVNITVNNGGTSTTPAVAKADYYTTTKNTGKNLNVLANDTGSGSKAIDTLYQYTAKGGTTYKTPEGQVWYKPKTGFIGEDNFWYVMIDSKGRKNSAQVKINVR